MRRHLRSIPTSCSSRAAARRFGVAFASIGVVGTLLVSGQPARAGKTAPVPDILFLGDSHLSFGAGRVFTDFFRDFADHCRSLEQHPGQAAAIARRSFSLMGVKSTAIHTWVSPARSLKRMICVPDPKWPVNARLYGFPHRQDGSYVQFGKDRSFPYCRARRESGLEALFAWGQPKLLILYFMGNTIERWARSQKIANRDADRLVATLPQSTGCLVMTTSPVYKRGHNAMRLKAQANIKEAFARHGGRCGFLGMLTPATVGAIEANREFFRRRRNGRVRDPYHPNMKAARKLVELQRRPLCRAVMSNFRQPSARR